MPQLTLTVDRDRAALLDVPVAQIFSSLQTAFGGTRAGDFSRNNRVYHVVMQNEMQWRERAEQISELYVRSRDGERVRLSIWSPLRRRWGAVYSAVQSVPVRVGERFSGRGVSSRTAMAAMEQILQAHLPPGYDYARAGSRQEQQTGNQAGGSCWRRWRWRGCSVAQYESWTLPASVMLGAVRHRRSAALAVDRGLCQRCVCSDRAGAADRPGGEECDSDVEFARSRREEGCR